MLKEYKTVYEGGEGEYITKKSRFIATVRPVHSEEEALAFVDEMKKTYWNATHNCYAFVCGENSLTQRMSDDGEPQGTAGVPMLEVLLKRDLHDVCVVVTRYFGGTLLGAGGLIRAYQEATIRGLQESTVITKKPGKLMCVHMDYTNLGKIQYILANAGAHVLSTDYAENVALRYIAEEDIIKQVEKAITEATSGSVRPEKEKDTYFAPVKGEILLWDE